MPIYIGYLFLGLACGILGQQAHIAPIEAFIMSILAYSGSGQFICIAMLLDNASLFSILVTNFMVSLFGNLRPEHYRRNFRGKPGQF